MPGEAETFPTVINKMTYETDFKLINLLLTENANLTLQDQNTSMHEREIRWNIHLVLYDTWTPSAKPSNNGWVSHWLWSIEIFPCLIGTWWKIAWAAGLWWMLELDSHIESLYSRVSIHCMTGVVRQCGCFPECIKIQRMMLWWNSTVPMHCNSLWNLSCMQPALKMKIIKRMQYTGWYWCFSPGTSACCRNWYMRWVNHWNRYWRTMHALLISDGLRTSTRHWRTIWRDTLHGVRQEHGGYIYGCCHVSHWYWGTPRIWMTCMDNTMMTGHLILGWILWFSNVCDAYCSQSLSRNLWSIPNLTMIKHQMRCFWNSLKVINAPCLLHLLLKRLCYSVHCHAKLIIWSGGPHTFLWILGYWRHVFRNGQQWPPRNAAEIPRFAQCLCVCNYTKSGFDRPQSQRCKPCSNNSEVLGIEWAVAEIWTSYPTGAKLCSTHMAVEYWTQWLL